MSVTSHQTVRLSRGKHSSPDSGACVMELASMLDGEEFSDHPRSVSRTLAAFLRCYNDRIDDRRRQELYAYAAKVVGTAGSIELESDRAERLVRWTDERRARRPLWPLVTRRSRHSVSKRPVDPECAARYAIRAICRVSDDMHASVLELLDELIAFGATQVDVSSEDSAADAFCVRPLGAMCYSAGNHHRAGSAAEGPQGPMSSVIGHRVSAPRFVA